MSISHSRLTQDNLLSLFVHVCACENVCHLYAGARGGQEEASDLL